jgi:hypothetical protein
MKVFVSWSGSVAKEIASAISRYLELIVPGVECFVSSDEIEKGSRWSSAIAQQLQDSDYGILILTKENIAAPWLFFEAGALSKSLDRGRVAPILFNITVADIASTPLGQFQSAFFAREEVGRLCRELAKAGQVDDPEKIQSYFEKFWPDLDQAVTKALGANPRVDVSKDPVEQTLREFNRRLASISAQLSRPELVLPIEYLSRAILHANDKEGVVAKLSGHIFECEQVIDEIGSALSYLDLNDIEELRDFVGAVEGVTAGFQSLEDKSRSPDSGSLFETHMLASKAEPR